MWGATAEGNTAQLACELRRQGGALLSWLACERERLAGHVRLVTGWAETSGGHHALIVAGRQPMLPTLVTAAGAWRQWSVGGLAWPMPRLWGWCCTGVAHPCRDVPPPLCRRMKAEERAAEQDRVRQQVRGDRQQRAG